MKKEKIKKRRIKEKGFDRKLATIREYRVTRLMFRVIVKANELFYRVFVTWLCKAKRSMINDRLTSCEKKCFYGSRLIHVRHVESKKERRKERKKRKGEKEQNKKEKITKRITRKINN